MGDVTATGGVLPFFRDPGCPRLTGFFSSPTLDESSQLSGRSLRHLEVPGSIFRLPLSYSSFLGAFSSDSLNQLSPLSASERFSESVRSTIVEFLREAVGVVGRELREELALNSSELRLSEASLSPLLMELLSSQL